MPCQDQKHYFAPVAVNNFPTEIVGRPRCARSWPALASVALHGVLLFFILLGGSVGPGGLADTGGGALSVFEVGLLSLPGASGRSDLAQSQEMFTVPSPERQEPESALEPEDSAPLSVEPPKEKEQLATRTRRPERPQRPQQNVSISETQGENGAGRDSLGGTSDQPARAGALGTDAAPGAEAGGGRPFGFSLGEVNGKPKVLKNVPVVYPIDARRKGLSGQVLVRFHLDENGAVSHLHIKSAEPPDIFNHNTLTAIRQWRFQPARHEGRAVPVWVEMPIEFVLR